MSGFGGSWTRRGHRDQNEFPTIARPRVVQLMRDVPTCVGPLSYDRLDLAERECDDLLAAVPETRAQPQELFMSAASPDIIALTMKNNFYASYEDYVMALAGEMRKEYELIASKGLVLQLDCPDLAMERHVSYQDRAAGEVPGVGRSSYRGHQPRHTEHPQGAGKRLHVCWGNSEGPHHYDVPLGGHPAVALLRPTLARWSWRWPTRGTPTSTRSTRNTPCREGMLLVAGVIDTKTNYVEHPEVVADRLRLAVQAAGRRPYPGDGRDRLRVRHVGWLQPCGERRGVAQAQGDAGRGRYSQQVALLGMTQLRR